MTNPTIEEMKAAKRQLETRFFSELVDFEKVYGVTVKHVDVWSNSTINNTRGIAGCSVDVKI